MRSRKAATVASRDKDSIEHGTERAMCCCQIPPYHDPRPSRREAAGTGAPAWMWASLAAGIAFLSLSLTTAIMLAITL